MMPHEIARVVGVDQHHHNVGCLIEHPLLTQDGAAVIEVGGHAGSAGRLDHRSGQSEGVRCFIADEHQHAGRRCALDGIAYARQPTLEGPRRRIAVTPEQPAGGAENARNVGGTVQAEEVGGDARAG